MIKIFFYTKTNCEACRIMNNILLSAINNTTAEIRFKKITKEKYDALDIPKREIKVFPTVIIMDDFKEIAALEGTYPEDYIIKIIDKLKTLKL